MSIGVILTSHKRPHTLRPQIEAIRRQSISPAVLCVWHNGSQEQNGSAVPVAEMKCVDEVVYCSNNRGVWGRFLYGLELGTKYVAVFDDDTIPGTRWLETCMEVLDGRGAVVGCSGVVFAGGVRPNRVYIGNRHDVANEMPVDIVGHSWVFPVDLLRDFANLTRPPHATCGEDYMLSVAAQLRRGWQTIVPPQPANEPERWGSRQPNLGRDDKALWSTPGEEEKKQASHDHYLAMGWKPLALQTSTLPLPTVLPVT